LPCSSFSTSWAVKWPKPVTGENSWSAAGPAVVSCSFSTDDTGEPPALRRWAFFIPYLGVQRTMSGSHGIFLNPAAR